MPPLLGAAKTRLGARSSRRRQWVESEPCGQLHLNFLLFPLPPASLLAPLFLPLPITTLLRYGTLEPKWSIPTSAPFPAGAPNSHKCPIPCHITTSLRYDAPAQAPALLSKVVHSKGLRPLPPTQKKQINFEFESTVKLKLEFDFDFDLI